MDAVETPMLCTQDLPWAALWLLLGRHNQSMGPQATALHVPARQEPSAESSTVTSAGQEEGRAASRSAAGAQGSFACPRLQAELCPVYVRAWLRSCTLCAADACPTHVSPKHPVCP